MTFTPLAAGESNEVKAIVKDPQGNSSKEGIDTAKTEEAEVPPTKIVVEVKDDFTDEYKGAKLVPKELKQMVYYQEMVA